ncbi:hypothetical protein BC830DRAFT_534649 [Chytriomyces sp. MP71]|nr:hypothetical protein BC830DRAFT_534649 [Chytriomyces sp. MP71]
MDDAPMSSGAGRKRIAADGGGRGENKRTVLNRNNQRAYRERQKERMTALETEVVELRKALAAKTDEAERLRSQLQLKFNPSSGAVPTPKVEMATSHLLLPGPAPPPFLPASQLDPPPSATAVGGTWQSPPQLPPLILPSPSSQSARSPPPNQLALAASTAFKTSEQLYGPIRVDFIRYSFKGIPSLSQSPKVDILLDFIVAQTKISDREQMKVIWLRSFATWHSLLDECTPQDSNKALEVHLAFSQLNQNHFDHIMGIVESGSTLDSVLQLCTYTTNSAKPATIEAYSALKAIPSLATAGLMLDHLIILYLNVAQCGADGFIQSMKIVKQLEQLCTSFNDQTELSRQLINLKNSSRENVDAFTANILTQLQQVVF